MKKADPIVFDRVKTTVNSMGYELFGIEVIPQGRRFILRIYIDNPNGVTLDGCALISRQISVMLDAEDLIQGAYILEVSSPGMNRPLFELEHYRKFIGRRIKIWLVLPVNQRRQYKGILKKIEGENICLLLDDVEQEITLPFSTIEKASLIEV